MWHMHWRADAARRLRPVDATGDGTRAERRRAGSTTPSTSRGSFQYVWHDTPAAVQAGDVPESVRVRGR